MKKLGIKKETKSIWEGRVPLNPQSVETLIKNGYEVYVESSNIRIYKDEEYKKVGAIITDDISHCDFIIGVKEIKMDELMPDKPQLFFSHTSKGQDYNMHLLKYILDNNVTLFDYEKIIDDEGRRLVFFGKFAGIAGMVDSLYGVGQRLKQHYDIETPFMNIKQSYQYDSIIVAKESIKKAGEEITKNGLPKDIAPFVIFLMGYGNVAEGCRDILNELPIEEIDPDDLSKLDKNFNNHKIYLATFKEKHMIERKDGSEFDLQHYFHNGEAYKSKLGKYLPYASMYMNAIFWAAEYPVFLDKSELLNLQKQGKLQMIGDVTCDIEGSIKATVKSTEPDNPIYIYDAENGKITDGFKGDGIPDCAIDHLPCEFPKESSDAFSNVLMPFIEKILDADFSKSIDKSELPNEIKKSCIAHQGKLEKDFLYLEEFLK